MRTVYMLDDDTTDKTLGYWRSRELAEKRAAELGVTPHIAELHPPEGELLHGACEDDYDPTGKLLPDPTIH